MLDYAIMSHTRSSRVASTLNNGALSKAPIDTTPTLIACTYTCADSTALRAFTQCSLRLCSAQQIVSGCSSAKRFRCLVCKIVDGS